MSLLVTFIKPILSSCSISAQFITLEAMSVLTLSALRVLITAYWTFSLIVDFVYSQKNSLVNRCSPSREATHASHQGLDSLGYQKNITSWFLINLFVYVLYYERSVISQNRSDAIRYDQIRSDTIRFCNKSVPAKNFLDLCKKNSFWSSDLA